MLIDMVLLEDDDLVVCGQVAVVDLQGVSFGHIGQFAPSLIKYELNIVTFNLLIKISQFHFHTEK